MSTWAAKAAMPMAAARSQGTSPPGQASSAKGSTTGSPATQKKKKMVGALSVPRMARMTFALTAAKKAAPRAAASPQPSPRWTVPLPSTSNTPAVASAMATQRCPEGRSPRSPRDRSVAATGNRL